MRGSTVFVFFNSPTMVNINFVFIFGSYINFMPRTQPELKPILQTVPWYFMLSHVVELVLIFYLFLETQLYFEVYTGRPHKSCILRQVQPKWGMVG